MAMPRTRGMINSNTLNVTSFHRPRQPLPPGSPLVLVLVGRDSPARSMPCERAFGQFSCAGHVFRRPAGTPLPPGAGFATSQRRSAGPRGRAFALEVVLRGDLAAEQHDEGGD